MNKEDFPLISIQILNWNRKKETERAIESAKNQTYPNIEIVVVDNGSSDGSVKFFQENYKWVNQIPLDKNYGCPGGRNRGVPYCNGEFIFYLDNDGVLHNNAVQNAYQAFLSKNNVGIVTGTIYEFENENEIDPSCDYLSNDRYIYSRFQGGISMHKKEIYEEVGLYPDHFIYGSEELYMSLKLMDTKFTILKDESVILWHKRSDFARDKNTETVNKFFNRLYTAVVLFPLLPLIVFIFKFIVVYPYYAKKHMVLNQFIQKFRSCFLSIIILAKNTREPISLHGYYKFLKFRNKIGE